MAVHHGGKVGIRTNRQPVALIVVRNSRKETVG